MNENNKTLERDSDLESAEIVVFPIPRVGFRPLLPVTDSHLNVMEEGR
jgi:hypothetical protein